MPKYDYFEHTADIGIRGYGTNFTQALEYIARGMMDYILDSTGLKDSIKQEFEINGTGREELIVRFLNKLLFLFETEHFVPVRYEIIQSTSGGETPPLQIQLHGDKFDSTKQQMHAEIKSATYHNLEIKENHECIIQVIVDV